MSDPSDIRDTRIMLAIIVAALITATVLVYKLF